MLARPSLALALVLAVVAGGCGDQTRTDKGARQSLQVGYAFGFDAGDVGDRVALARLTRRSGIDFRFRELGGLPNAVVALLRGDVQLATMPYSSAIRAAGAGAAVRAVLGTNMASEFLLVSRPGIRSVADLRGKRVASDAPGLDGETLVLQTLARGGVPRSAVRLSSLGDSTARAAALGAGRLDATVLEYVDLERLREREPGLTVLARLAEFRPRSAQTVWVVSEKYAQAHRALLQRVVDGFLDGYRFDYQPAGRRAWLALARTTVLEGQSPTLAARVYDYYRAARFWPLRDAPITRAQHDRTVRFWLGAGQLDRSVPFARVWDTRFWTGAAAG